jgi:hypothetical protein
MKSNAFIHLIFAALFAIIAVGAFALSYSNLVETAIDAGINPVLAPLWPLCLDLSIVAGSLFVLLASLRHEKTTEGWIMLLCFTVVSTAFNVVHSPPDLLSRVAHGLPPVIMFSSLEILMIRLKRDLLCNSECGSKSNDAIPYPEDKVRKVLLWFAENPEGSIEGARKELRMGYATVRDIRTYLVHVGKLGSS